MARGAIQRGRHVIGDLAHGRSAVVATLAIARDSRVIETGWDPGQGAVTVTAFPGSRQMVARHGGCLHT